MSMFHTLMVADDGSTEWSDAKHTGFRHDDEHGDWRAVRIPHNASDSTVAATVADAARLPEERYQPGRWRKA